ncbi:dATP/dGTP diphosphohydrolase domain-containing protein [Sphingomonas sp.]|uniref:dATP/dGTP diphosphohydrolase domain-containing protein n=1 Tax=Sphingomonas sp. TaxID=28214 RepID=UPI002EDB39BC
MSFKEVTCFPDGAPCTCTRAGKACCAETRYGSLADLYPVTTESKAASPTDDRPSLPDDATARLAYPMADGLLDYFPNALAEVARLSHVATQQHHPDAGMHWDRSKSTDHRNKIMRHLVDTGKLDDKGMRHSAMVAWRALALLQEELEAADGLPPSRASRNRPEPFTQGAPT